MKVRGLGAGLGASLPFPERRSLWMSWGGFRIVYYLCMYRPFGGLRFSIGRLRGAFFFLPWLCGKGVDKSGKGFGLFSTFVCTGQ